MATVTTVPLDAPSDQFQRYHIIVDIIRALLPEGPKQVVEVGGDGLMLKAFLQETEIISVDPNDKGASMASRITPGKRLDFEDHSLKTIVSVDTLEHIIPDERDYFMNELARITESFLIIGCPCQPVDENDPDTSKGDSLMLEFIKARHSYTHEFFQDHVSKTLPNLNDIEYALRDSGLYTRTLPSANYSQWMLMVGLHYALDARPEYENLQKQVHQFFNSNYNKTSNKEPVYRRIIIASRKRLTDEQNSNLDNLLPPATDTPTMSLEPLRVILEAARITHEAHLDGAIASLTAQLNTIASEMKSLKDYVHELEDFKLKVEGTFTHRVYRRFIKKTPSA